MREIKFRAWYQNKMWIVSEMEFDKGEEPEVYENSYGNVIKKYPLLLVHLWRYKKGKKHAEEQDVVYRDTNGEYNTELVLLEFTGVTTENNQEIYEGNIVTKYDGSDVFVVVYEDKIPYYKCIKATSGYNKIKDKYLLNNKSNIEKIIGNIYEHAFLYENKDLLKTN